MLRASKQIHNETALLPYALTTFIFDGATPIKDLKRFFHCLTVPERDAVTSIHVCVSEGSFGIHSGRPTKQMVPYPKLAQLATLTLTVEVHSNVLYRDPSAAMWLIGPTLDAAVNFFALQTFAAVKVDVSIHMPLHNRKLVWQGEKLADMAREYESKLLKKSD